MAWTRETLRTRCKQKGASRTSQAFIHGVIGSAVIPSKCAVRDGSVVVRASWKNLTFTGSRSWPWRGAQPTQGGEAVVGALGLCVQRSTGLGHCSMRLGAASRLLHQETEEGTAAGQSRGRPRGMALVVAERVRRQGLGDSRDAVELGVTPVRGRWRGRRPWQGSSSCFWSDNEGWRGSSFPRNLGAVMVVLDGDWLEEDERLVGGTGAGGSSPGRERGEGKRWGKGAEPRWTELAGGCAVDEV
ncbi:hypothetical protein TRIUR3_28998 [Triticum urartu]|uniref:Uncharacterized protein n=1 Tax=Triticum urartu TaxID=4572 RepID=M8AJF0_TRIUA|nr:hypothetical protein TRIUR3_28998 [Triticum urartu]